MAHLHATDRVYPSFNDSPHERPILTDTGLGRAAAILTLLLGAAYTLAWLLSWL